MFTDSPFTAFEAMGPEIGAKPGQINEILFGSYEAGSLTAGEGSDHPWHRLERGEITLEQARDEILELGRDNYQLQIDLYELLAKMPRDGGLRQSLVDYVGVLKQLGMTTGIITK